MTKEEQNIRNKIEGLSDLDLYFDDNHLWNRLEEKLEQKKSHKTKGFVWIWSLAASVLFGGLFYWVSLDNPTKSVAQKPETKSTQTRILPEQENTLSNNLQEQVVENVKIIDNQLVVEDLVEPIVSKNLTYETENITSKKSFDSVFITSKSINPIINLKIENVTVLNLPIIPDEMMKREGFTKRLFRQIKNFNTEGKIDWRELNIEPRNVWAYLERNFKYDTTKIQIKKHSKL